MKTRTLFYLVLGLSMGLFSASAFAEGATGKAVFFFLCLVALFLGGFVFEIERRIDTGKFPEHNNDQDKFTTIPPH